MNSNVKFRIAVFGFLILLLAVMIGGVAHFGWKQFEQLQVRFSSSPIRSFQSADQFRATLTELDYLLLRYDLRHDEADWNNFVPDSKKLDLWIDAQTPTLTTPREKELFGKINAAYDFYQDAAKALHRHIVDPGGDPTPGGQFANVEKQSKGLLDLAFQLADAHQESLKLFLSGFERSLVLLRFLIFGALFALLVLGLWLAMIVYRDMIAPLHRQLVESHAIIERQEKLASLGVLAAGVAHEIRNPLTAIKARLFTQQKLLKIGSPELEDAEVIGSEINRLETIVRDVLQFARPADPHLVRIPAQAPLRDTQELLAPQLEKNGIGLKLGAVSDTHILADPQQLKQVLINLVQNAAESIGHNGTVTLRARNSTWRLHGDHRPVVILEVSDTGKGIALDVQKRLFDPFFSTKETGTGLGLAIAARIVEKHGGALEFQTQVNHGTTFGIVLPQAAS
jgi:signal transduction histidine kinase